MGSVYLSFLLLGTEQVNTEKLPSLSPKSQTERDYMVSFKSQVLLSVLSTYVPYQKKSGNVTRSLNQLY